MMNKSTMDIEQTFKALQMSQSVMIASDELGDGNKQIDKMKMNVITHQINEVSKMLHSTKTEQNILVKLQGKCQNISRL